MNRNALLRIPLAAYVLSIGIADLIIGLLIPSDTVLYAGTVAIITGMVFAFSERK